MRSASLRCAIGGSGPFNVSTRFTRVLGREPVEQVGDRAYPTSGCRSAAFLRDAPRTVRRLRGERACAAEAGMVGSYIVAGELPRGAKEKIE